MEHHIIVPPHTRGHYLISHSLKHLKIKYIHQGSVLVQQILMNTFAVAKDMKPPVVHFFLDYLIHYSAVIGV